MHNPAVLEPAGRVRFGLLGPLLAANEPGQVAVLRAAKQRTILAALLISANATVSADRLTEILWAECPPPSAATAVRNYVMRLRRQIGPAGSRIVARPGGYAVEISDPSELDVTEVDCLRRDARAAAEAGQWSRASALLGTALSLWRGEPLADIPSLELTQREIAHLAELRLQLTEARIDADLQLARHDELVAELRQFAAEHPLREHLRAQLMLALYRCGRQAEALEVYRDTRATLASELGVEPGPELQDLHQRMLTADVRLMAGQPRHTAGPPSPVSQGQLIPRQLPTGIRCFTGRAAELKALDAVLGEAAGAVGTAVISAVGGTAGVGKTALAIHWAWQVAPRFPDGQLYVNLRGYDPDEPMPAAEALAGFLRSLGVTGRDIPAGTDERAALFRSLLCGRRMLVVLDNAGRVEQVRPLLPGSPGCVTVATSRDALAGLVARDGAVRLDLDVLPLEEAVRLLRTLIGARVDAEPDAAAALAARCARLPLALRVAAELAAARPAATLTELAGELAGEQRLDLLDAGGDLRTGIRAVFSWSYQHLDPGAARLFRLLGLHPGPDLDVHAAAALASATVRHARRGLDVLARAHLIEAAGRGRHGMHDLLRAYARELAAAHDGEAGQRAALTRLFDYYLQASADGMDILFPAEADRRPSVPRPAGCAVPDFDHLAGARAWLDAERANLVATSVHAAVHGWPGHATRLAATLFRYLDAGGHFSQAVIIHGHARAAAAQLGDRAAEADALTSLGLVDVHQGRYPQAAGHLRQALALSRETGDRARQARALQDLGLGDFQQGRWPQATRQLEEARDLFCETGDRIGEARVLGNLAIIEFQQGRLEQAAAHLRQALAVCREAGHLAGEAYILANLGGGELLQGRYDQAVGYLRQALPLFRETANRTGEAHVLANLGVVDLRKGRYENATSFLRQALALFRETGDRAGEAEALNGLGEVQLATGQPGGARAQHAAALAVTSQTGDKYEQARAHVGLAHSHDAARESAQADDHWRQALALYTSLGAPEANEIRTRLAAGKSPPR
jgi:DNA-binding SARP family transcriptional activator/tetratricopeptide (TPR) repeat protein